MIKKTRILFLVTLLLSAANYIVKAQFYIDNEPVYNDALSYIDAEEYEEALPLLQMLEKRGIHTANVQYNIGTCYLNIEGLKHRAIRYLDSASMKMSDSYSGKYLEVSAPYKTLLLLGTAYRIDNQLENAISAFNRFIKVSSDTVLEQKALLNIRQCNIARLMLKYPTRADVVTLSQSSMYSVYNPVEISSDTTLYYMEKMKFYDAIVRSKLSGKKLNEPENLTPEFGSDGDYTIVGNSSDGKTMIFKGYESGKGLQLYYSERNNSGKWQKIVPFPEPVNSAFNETSASFSPDGQTLYISSNRSGGQGSNDIYKTQKLENGNWSDPVNLGAVINTPSNEDSPYVSPDGSIFYFCSEGHMNMGGYDFFASTINPDGSLSHPVNLGSPISTTDNDLFLFPSINSGEFFTDRTSSDEESTRLCKITVKDAIPSFKLYLQGKLDFSDSIPARPVVYNVVDKSTQSTIEISKTDANGNFDQMLKQGKYTLNFLYNDSITAAKSIEVNPAAGVDELFIESPAWSIKVTEKQFVLMIKDILFGFDSYALPTEYTSMLDSIASLMNQFSETHLAITGFTDSKGSIAYNLILSQKRAQSVLNYLVSKGVSSNRLKVEGKGKDSPVALNNNSDGTDNSKGRKYNRRVTVELQFSGQKIKILKAQLVPAALKIN
jgi:outer membrane protein OmpA-like peptidoglycan-associated protein/tetratricopeptide (TPR) repeat protein